MLTTKQYFFENETKIDYDNFIVSGKKLQLIYCFASNCFIKDFLKLGYKNYENVVKEIKKDGIQLC